MSEKRRQYRRKWMAASRLLRNKPDCEGIQHTPYAGDVQSATPDGSACITESVMSDVELLHNSSPSPCLSSINSRFENFSHVTSSESETDDDVTDNSLKKDLSMWATQFNVPQNAVDKLLKLLQKAGHHLPSTARGLLKTKRNVVVDVKSDLDYVYLGFDKELDKFLREQKDRGRPIPNHLELSLNIDGLPLFKSSNTSTWPVLCAVVSVQPICVFPVALACGSTKPKNLDFLTDTISNLNKLLQQGLTFDDCIITVSLRCIVCDAPARSMVKAVKLYSGYAGCDKCNQKGKWLGRMTYPEVDNIELRSDGSFRSQLDSEHHHDTSPFCSLPINMITTFPNEYMHECCLGVTKKLMLAWLRGKPSVRLSANQSNEISMRMLELRNCVPNIFARKPRSLLEIDRWKATEFRLFLLYIGKIVLKKTLRDDLFQHFLTFSVAMCILVSPSLVSKHSQYAHELLLHFVKECKRLYGDEFLIYNVHGLIHLSAEAERFGCLDNCSAFPFENYLQRLKKLVRSGKNPIVQIVKRLSEMDSMFKSDLTQVSSKKARNRCYILDDSTCCEVLHNVCCMHKRSDEETCKCDKPVFECRIYNKSASLFNDPCDSRIIGTYVVNVRDAVISHIVKDRIRMKAVMVDLKKNSLYCFMAVLHDIVSY